LAVKSFHYIGKAKYRPIHLILINHLKSYDFIKSKDVESEDIELKMLYFYEKFSIFLLWSLNLHPLTAGLLNEIV